jgi:hypothetical protein
VATENYARAAAVKLEMEQLEAALNGAASANEAAAGSYSGGGGGNLGGATGYGVFNPTPTFSPQRHPKASPARPAAEAIPQQEGRRSGGGGGYAGQGYDRGGGGSFSSPTRPPANDPYVLATQEMRRTRAGLSPQDRPPHAIAISSSLLYGAPPHFSATYNGGSPTDGRGSSNARYHAPPSPHDASLGSAPSPSGPKGKPGWKPAGAVALPGMIARR